MLKYNLKLCSRRTNKNPSILNLFLQQSQKKRLNTTVVLILTNTYNSANLKRLGTCKVNLTFYKKSKQSHSLYFFLPIFYSTKRKMGRKDSKTSQKMIFKWPINNNFHVWSGHKMKTHILIKKAIAAGHLVRAVEGRGQRESIKVTYRKDNCLQRTTKQVIKCCNLKFVYS